MQDRRQEIEGLVNSFWATLQPIVSRYRGMEQSDENVVQHFATRVETERARYARKFEALRSDTSCKDLGELIASVERQINNMADHEIARARADGMVEHDHLSARSVCHQCPGEKWLQRPARLGLQATRCCSDGPIHQSEVRCIVTSLNLLIL
jgi:hypothetical protein